MRKQEKTHSEALRENPRQVLEYFTPLDRQILAILVEMERRLLARPPMPQKNDQPVGKDSESWCRSHKSNSHMAEDCWVLKRDIEK